MPATALALSTPYTLFDNETWLWLPAVAAADHTPVRTEINAGTDVTSEIISIDGFSTSTDMIQVPRMRKRFVGQTPGRVNPADSSITYYLSKLAATPDIRSLQTQNLAGFLCAMEGGDVAGNLMDTYPVIVTSPTKGRDIEALAQLQVMYAITDTPSENKPVPT